MATTTEDGSVTFESQTLNLVCIDSSKHSKRALEWYFDNQHRDGDQVGLVHVFVPPDLPAFGIYAGGMAPINMYQETLQAGIEDSKKIVEEYKAYCLSKGVSPKYFVQSLNDSIGHTICDIAKQNKAKMMVLGQRGLGAIRRTFLGSVSDYVIHHAHIPVLIVPPK
ncbi:universal stress protein Slr1101-like [Clytia hemisphaerica]|uniref:UspA domain-containing protein n=1 Tax=Clytia hemisphaerica TaxID=252671 RepID=A0A7M5WZZ4_9CNID